MAVFEWICRECNIWWDRECAPGKAPDRTRCPKCKTLSNRYWQQQGVTISFKDDGAGNQNNPGVQMMNLFVISLLILTGINLLTLEA